MSDSAKKVVPSGKKGIDYLPEDDLLPGQKWVCLSFISPEGKIKNCKIRGLKVRGVYDSREEADERATALQKIDPDFDVFVGEVGKWLPWDPDPHDESKVKDVVYNEHELQRLAKAHKEHRQKVKHEEAERKRSMLENAEEHAKENERKNHTMERLRNKLAEAKAKKTNKEIMTTDDPLTTIAGSTGKKKITEKTNDELKEMEEVVMADAKLFNEERNRLESNTKNIVEKEAKLNDLSSKLNKIQSLYKQLQEKKEKSKNAN